MNDPASRRSFLVFEAIDFDRDTPPRSAYDSRGNVITRGDPPQVYGYTCIAAVSAPDEMMAARAVIGVTRRLSKLAVIEAAFIDFGAEVHEPDAVQLNP